MHALLPMTRLSHNPTTPLAPLPATLPLRAPTSGPAAQYARVFGLQGVSLVRERPPSKVVHGHAHAQGITQAPAHASLRHLLGFTARSTALINAFHALPVQRSCRSDPHR